MIKVSNGAVQRMLSLVAAWEFSLPLGFDGKFLFGGGAGATNALLVDDTNMCNNVRLRNDIFMFRILTGNFLRF